MWLPHTKERVKREEGNPIWSAWFRRAVGRLLCSKNSDGILSHRALCIGL